MKRDLKLIDEYKCPDCGADYVLDIENGFLWGDCPNGHGCTIYSAVESYSHA